MAEMFPRVFVPRITPEEIRQTERKAEALQGSAAEEAWAEVKQQHILLAGEKGEEKVFHALEKMPDDWVIFHSVDIIEPPSKNNENAHEVDFVILIPNKGILCLEVKNWSPRTIESKALGGEPMPHVKAKIAKETFVHWLEKRGLKKTWFEHRSAVVMLNATIANEEGNNLYINSADALRPAVLKERILSQFVNDTGLRFKDLQTIRQCLTAAQVYKISLDDYLSRLNQTTAPLDKLLPMLEESEGNISVCGGAGTGKTFMATQEAARLAAAGRKVLFLCFNKNLACCIRQDAAVAQQIAEGRLTVNNFHRFCSEILQDSYHMGELTPEQVESIESALIEAQYDAVFVDEAQDFTPQWWEISEYALKDKGRLYLFYDEKQVLRNGTRLQPTPIRLRLSTNLRNTAEIADYGAAAIGEQAPQTLAFRGPKVQVSAPVKDPKKRAAAVQQLVDNLLSGKLSHIFAPKRNQIVILSPWRPENEKSCARYLTGLNIPTKESHKDSALAEARYLDTLFNPDSKEILYETIKAFKGLESDFIILTDIRKPNSDPRRGFTPAEFYVAATRARYGLYVIPME